MNLSAHFRRADLSELSNCPTSNKVPGRAQRKEKESNQIRRKYNGGEKTKDKNGKTPKEGRENRGQGSPLGSEELFLQGSQPSQVLSRFEPTTQIAPLDVRRYDDTRVSPAKCRRDFQLTKRSSLLLKQLVASREASRRTLCRLHRDSIIGKLMQRSFHVAPMSLIREIPVRACNRANAEISRGDQSSFEQPYELSVIIAATSQGPGR